jgi:hypothetical protein
MKTATTKLVVALFSLLAAVLELGAAMVRLVTALALRAASTVRPRCRPLPARAEGRPNLRVITGTTGPTGPNPRYDLVVRRERLTNAMTGMGFRATDVRAFVNSLGDRACREPIETLIKEGLAHLAA